jgi:predicted site-specific integrase-resolvase
MNEKEKTLLIRISQDLSDEISVWAEKAGHNKSSLVRNSIRYYINFLSSENPEVLELIKGIIITKIDKVQTSYNDGKLIAFTRVVRISSTLSCNVCRDENDEEYVVYNIPQQKDENMVEAIHRYAEKLYSIWRNLPELDKKKFLVDLQMNHVYFSIQVEA